MHDAKAGRAAGALLLAALLGSLLSMPMACRREAPKPSPEYEAAHRTYEKLYVTQLDDAYGNPQMDEVLAQLRRVDAASADAEAARKLIATIELGKADLAKARAEDAKRRAQLTPPSRDNTSIDAARIVAAATAPAEPAAGADGGAVDAGPAAPDPFGAGASIADLNRASGGCLVAGESFQERNTNRQGTLYRLATSPACKDKLPGLADQVLLVVDGRIYRRASASEVPAAPPPLAATPAPNAPPPAPPPSPTAPIPEGAAAPSGPNY